MVTGAKGQYSQRERRNMSDSFQSRRGRLKNGNPLGDFATAPRCGAKARTQGGRPCRAPAMHGKGRCRMHGGQSTGPRTPSGLDRSRRARWKHGAYSMETRQRFLRLKAEYRAFNAACAARQARIMAAAKVMIRGLRRHARHER
jgi:hypothetical protein